jgi:hypothetical protein
VADVPVKLGGVLSVAPVDDVELMSVIATFQSPEAVPVPFTVRTCE